MRVADFQSIREADIELGKLTVVVGASNSGKSAFIRAIRAAARNVKSPSVVRHGAKKAVIELDVDGTTVALERGKAESTYRQGEIVFAKAGTSVPEEIEDVLRLIEVEGEDLSFAFQFDRPFLLDATGSQVAKVLGDLTGINQLYEAVREADRRRREAGQRAKVLEHDVEVLEHKLEEYAGLEDWGDLLKHVRTKLETAVETKNRLVALTSALMRLQEAGAALQELKRAPVSPDVDLGGLEQRVARVRKLELLIDRLTASKRTLKRHSESLGEMEAAIEELDDRYHETLADAGVCPVCGATTQRKG